MLHENAKQRLARVVPEQYDLQWFDPLRQETVTDTVTLDPATQIRWARSEKEPTYPCVFLNFSPQGTPRGDIGHMFEDGIYKEDHADPTIAYTKYTAAPQRSRLTVTVSVKQGTEMIPKRVVADTIAIQCWHAFRFNSDHLDEPGVDPSGAPLDYAWPMGVEPAGDGMDDTSRAIDELDLERRQFAFLIDYAYFHEEEVDAVDSIIWRLGVDRDFDGEADDWTDWKQTPGSEESTIEDPNEYMDSK